MYAPDGYYFLLTGRPPSTFVTPETISRQKRHIIALISCDAAIKKYGGINTILGEIYQTKKKLYYLYLVQKIWKRYDLIIN